MGKTSEQEENVEDTPAPSEKDDCSSEKEKNSETVPEAATQSGPEIVEAGPSSKNAGEYIEAMEIAIRGNEGVAHGYTLIVDKELAYLYLLDFLIYIYPHVNPTNPPPSPNLSSSDITLARRKIKFQKEHSTEKYKKNNLKLTVPVKEINIIDNKLKTAQTSCVPFSEVIPFATTLVDGTIEASTKIAKSHLTPNADLDNYCITYKPEDGSEATFENYNIFSTTFPRWPSIQNFTKNAGLAAIDDFLANWEYKENWLYCIEFLFVQSDECSEFYLYDVKWSIPTNAYPVAQATASVYFTIEVSRVKPPCCPVDVTYTFESSRLVHSATKIIFNESWLSDIIDSKIKLFRRIQF